MTAVQFVGYSPDITFRPSVTHLVAFNYLHPGMAVSRSTEGSFRGAEGVFGFRAANFPRWDYGDAGLPSGLLIEPTRTNFIRNARMLGAIAGSPGTSPTFAALAQTNCTSAVVGSSETSGIRWVEYAITFSGSGSWRYDFEDTSVPGFSLPNGGSVAFSCFAQLVGAVPAQYTGANLRLTLTSSGTVTPSVTLDASLARVSTVQTYPVSTTASLAGLVINANGACVVNVRIGAPQFEIGTAPSSFIYPPAGSSVASTRNSDSVASVALDAIRYNQAEGTFVIRWASFNFAENVIFRMAGSSTAVFELRRLDASNLRLRKTNLAGNTDITIPLTHVSGQMNTLSAAYANNRMAASLNGGNVLSATGGVHPVVTSLRIGSEANNTFPMHGRIQNFYYIPKAAGTRELQFLSSIS